MENSNEIWQTSVNGQVYEANFEELVQWITEGSLLPQDKVRKGNLRWIEAQKVPALLGFFNAKDLGIDNQVVTSTIIQTPNSPAQVQNFRINSHQPIAQNFQEPPPPTFYSDLNPLAERKFCVIHTDANAKYHCETCANYFCKSCPINSICPMCGADCKILDLPNISPSTFPPPLTQSIPNQEIIIDEDVKKGAHWFYWKAGLTVINSVLMMAGIYWQFFLGLAIPQLIHGFLIGFSQMEVSDGLSSFHGPVLVISFVSSILMGIIGKQASKAKKWAFILGIIIFSFDGLVYLLAFSIFGVIIHGYAIYRLSKGYSACIQK